MAPATSSRSTDISEKEDREEEAITRSTATPPKRAMATLTPREMEWLACGGTGTGASLIITGIVWYVAMVSKGCQGCEEKKKMPTSTIVLPYLVPVTVNATASRAKALRIPVQTRHQIFLRLLLSGSTSQNVNWSRSLVVVLPSLFVGGCHRVTT